MGYTNNANLNAAMRRDQVMRELWVNVNDNLPEEERGVLVSSAGFVTKAYLRAGVWKLSGSNEEMGGPVTHWMPLPEPPKP